MTFAVPAAGPDEPEAVGSGAWQEPEISVSLSVADDTAELMALVTELIDSGRDGVIRGRIEAPGRQGRQRRRGCDWMITSVRRLAREADSILACESIACDRGLARYWRRPPGGRKERRSMATITAATTANDAAAACQWLRGRLAYLGLKGRRRRAPGPA